MRRRGLPRRSRASTSLSALPALGGNGEPIEDASRDQGIPDCAAKPTSGSPTQDLKSQKADHHPWHQPERRKPTGEDKIPIRPDDVSPEEDERIERAREGHHPPAEPPVAGQQEDHLGP